MDETSVKPATFDLDTCDPSVGKAEQMKAVQKLFKLCAWMS
jgi:hypothetical protein